ncbi:hypothetical protein C1646_760776 [Rhizophagus diaphanus]|nr:hypothetical protein C1646_760776 [Rhizophagus diaphanus] [Rhizophagus sp. MUCL 43196]
MSQVSPCEKHDGFHVTTIHHLCRYVKNKFINTILKLFIIDIDSEPKNIMPMFWKCAKDHLWSARLSSVKNENTWCPQCAVENRRTQTIEDMKKFAEKKGGFCLTIEYVNHRRDILEWQCKEGHKWKASAKDILKGTRHDHVTHQPIDIANSIAQERGAKEIAHSRGGMCLSTEYINLCVPMQWMCNKGHNVITNILGPPSSIRRPDFLKIPENPRGLELDIYYPQYGFATYKVFSQRSRRISKAVDA